MESAQAIQNGKFQAVIFDLDGVLMDSEWIGFLVAQELARQHGGHLDASLFPKMIGITAEETVTFVMENAGVQLDMETSVAWLWKAFIEEIRRSAVPLPGAVALLEELARRGLPLAIASNSVTDYVNNSLDVLKLGSFFPFRIGADQVVKGKPAPDLYLLAAQRLGIEPQHCLAIEDSRVGVRAAVAAGMRVLAIPGERDHQEGFSDAWRVYPSLVQVCETLDEALA